jgi:hypothetical protein
MTVVMGLDARTSRWIGLAVRAHLIWVVAMAISVLLLGTVLQGGPKATDAWGIWIGVPFLVITLIALVPINLVGVLLVWAARGRLMATICAVGALGVAWFLIGVFFTPGEPTANRTTFWLSTGGIAFGVVLARLIWNQLHPVSSR